MKTSKQLTKVDFVSNQNLLIICDNEKLMKILLYLETQRLSLLFAHEDANQWAANCRNWTFFMIISLFGN